MGYSVFSRVERLLRCYSEIQKQEQTGQSVTHLEQRVQMSNKKEDAYNFDWSKCYRFHYLFIGPDFDNVRFCFIETRRGRIICNKRTMERCMKAIHLAQTFGRTLRL